MIELNVVIDVRKILPSERLSTVFAAFDGLAHGEKMEIINSHDPSHIHEEFDAERDGQYDWRYLEEGPVVWRIQITKI